MFLVQYMIGPFLLLDPVLILNFLL